MSLIPEHQAEPARFQPLLKESAMGAAQTVELEPRVIAEVADPSPALPVAVANSETAAIIAMIERAAVNPNVDIDKMERLFEMRERIEARNAERAYNAALAAMQPELPIIDEQGAIRNNKDEVQSTYAKWDDINEAIRPVLAKYGFGISFRPGRTTEGLQCVTGVLRHRDGHKEEATITLPVDSSGSKNSVQAIGSSLSYGQRYTAKALLNLTSRKSDDDDGQRAGLCPAAEAMIADIEICGDLDEFRAAKAKIMPHLDTLPKGDRQAVVSTCNAKQRKLKGEG